MSSFFGMTCLSGASNPGSFLAEIGYLPAIDLLQHRRTPEQRRFSEPEGPMIERISPPSQTGRYL